MNDFMFLVGVSVLVATCVCFCGRPTKIIIDDKTYCFDCEVK